MKKLSMIVAFFVKYATVGAAIYTCWHTPLAPVLFVVFLTDAVGGIWWAKREIERRERELQETLLASRALEHRDRELQETLLASRALEPGLAPTKNVPFEYGERIEIQGPTLIVASDDHALLAKAHWVRTGFLPTVTRLEITPVEVSRRAASDAPSP